MFYVNFILGLKIIFIEIIYDRKRFDKGIQKPDSTTDQHMTPDKQSSNNSIEFKTNNDGLSKLIFNLIKYTWD